MKEKILPILEKAVKNSTFSERTFSEVADAIAKAAVTAGITDDKLEAFVTDMLPVFSTFQGDVNNQISEAVKKVKPSKKEDLEPQKQPTGEPKTLTAEDIAKAVAEANKPFIEKLDAFEVQNKVSKLTQDVRRQLISHYGISEKLCDKVLARIEIKADLTVEELAKNAVSEYNDLASSFGLDGVSVNIPAAGGDHGKADAHANDDLKAMLKAEGIDV
jgi:ribosomal protein S13